MPIPSRIIGAAWKGFDENDERSKNREKANSAINPASRRAAYGQKKIPGITEDFFPTCSAV
jgi:hypothetical protein